jgi:hypothetical protein
MTAAVRRLLHLLPVTRPHAGKHRARDDAAAARPAPPRPPTGLLVPKGDPGAAIRMGSWT